MNGAGPASKLVHVVSAGLGSEGWGLEACLSRLFPGGPDPSRGAGHLQRAAHVPAASSIRGRREERRLKVEASLLCTLVREVTSHHLCSSLEMPPHPAPPQGEITQGTEHEEVGWLGSSFLLPGAGPSHRPSHHLSMTRSETGGATQVG